VHQLLNENEQEIEKFEANIFWASDSARIFFGFSSAQTFCGLAFAASTTPQLPPNSPCHIVFVE